MIDTGLSTTSTRLIVLSVLVAISGLFKSYYFIQRETKSNNCIPSTVSYPDNIMNFFSSKSAKDEEWRNAASVYDFTVKDIDDQDVKLDKYKGKVLLIVNVASKCGLTKTNYKELNELHAKFHDQGLAILGFPSNSFAQEPGCSVDIKEFIKKNNVEWDIFAKIDVNGDQSHPLYKWLKTKCGGTLIDAIKWNFTKFLVDKQGQPIARFAPNKNPSELESDIEAELKK